MKMRKEVTTLVPGDTVSVMGGCKQFVRLDDFREISTSGGSFWACTLIFTDKTKMTEAIGGFVDVEISEP